MAESTVAEGAPAGVSEATESSGAKPAANEAKPDVGAMIVAALGAFINSPAFQDRVKEMVDAYREQSRRLADHKDGQRDRWYQYAWRFACVHAVLCTLTLATVLTLSLMDKLSSDAVVPLLAGVVASLFVKPSKAE